MHVEDLEGTEVRLRSLDSDELPDLAPRCTSSTASTANSSQKKGHRDDVLRDVVQRLSARRPAAADIMEAMQEEKVDRRTAYCRYLASEAREMSKEDWLVFKATNDKLLDNFKQQQQTPPPQPQQLPVLQQPQQQLNEQYEQFSSIDFTELLSRDIV